MFSPITAKNLSNVAIVVQGNLHLPQNITYVQYAHYLHAVCRALMKSLPCRSIVNGTSYAAGTGYWFTFSGPRIDFVGSNNITTGWIYSYGQAWWDANTYPGTGLANRPHLMSFNTTNGTIQHLKSSKPIGWNVQLLGSNITVTDTIIDAYSVTGSFPFNTDGFDVTATDVKILNSVIYNGDDAIAVQSGSHNVLFQGGTIGYQTHGMSIGSLGQNQAAYA